jgi:hypothetical protein
MNILLSKTETKLRGLSPRENSADAATAAKLVSIFADKVPRGQREGFLRPYSRLSGLEIFQSCHNICAKPLYETDIVILSHRTAAFVYTYAKFSIISFIE